MQKPHAVFTAAWGVSELGLTSAPASQTRKVLARENGDASDAGLHPSISVFLEVAHTGRY